MVKVAKTCTRCKSKKLKCDGSKPSCSRCLSLGITSCEYPPDKRVDKRQKLNGKDVFVFKNCDTTGDYKDIPETTLISPISQIEAGLDGSLSTFNASEFPTFFPSPEIGQQWPDFVPDLFQGDLNFSMDEFFCFLDDSVPLGSYDPLEQIEISPHKLLIDAVFSNKLHPPPGVSHEMILNIDMLQVRAEDEEFLHATILAMGALTLAKRDLVGQRQETMVDVPEKIGLKLPAMASEAYGHYSRARELIPSMLKAPSRHGFRGLAVMANFMSILLTPETQMYISYHALQIAISIGLTQMSRVEIDTEEYGLVIAFWGLWCSSCMLATFHGHAPPLMRSKISTTAHVQMKNRYVEVFFELRIKFAELSGIVAVVNKSEEINYQLLRKELSRLCEEISLFEESFPQEEIIGRHELFTLELKCWKAYVSMLLNLPALLEKRNSRAVVDAKNIVKDFWAYYYFYKRNFLPNLDWNFSYPLRNATLCVWFACMVLTRYINSSPALSFEFAEYKIGMELLTDLTGVIPINKYLIKELENVKNNELDSDKWLFKQG
ncbi:hypothetical protein OXX80_000953 [Metschnikowia pulcherrima]